MEFMERVLARESCRAYADKPVTREQLLKIAEAGRLSPSACNSQPWKFFIVDSPEAKAKMCEALILSTGKTGCAWGKSVPAFIALIEQPNAPVMEGVIEYYKDTQYFASSDIGMAALNMCYMAQDLGLSTCIIGMNDRDKMQSLFGVTPEENVRLVLAVGYALKEGAPREKKRRPLEDVVCFNEL